MTHVDYFKEFFMVQRRGTARAICDYLTERGVHFNCTPERRYVSVNRHISREQGKRYPTGIVFREKNADGHYEYFTTGPTVISVRTLPQEKAEPVIRVITVGNIPEEKTEPSL